MQIRNINKVITTNGDTSDIIQVVMMAYDIESDPQISELADTLKGNTISETCKNIWSYLIDNVNYRADADGHDGELIRTPARLIHDRTGDCKSYSLFTAVVLRYIGIKHIFRFASYNSRREATHVYVVAYDETGNEIIIDAVAAVQLNAAFGYEAKYTYRCDMENGKTKISYLAGLTKNNAIGNFSPSDDERYRVWMDDERETGITPGKAYLYAQYDLISERLNIATSETEKAALYNELSVIAAHLWAYNYVFGNSSDFDTMSLIIAGMVSNGMFSSYDTDESVRDDWFDNLLFQIEKYYVSNLLPDRYSSYWYDRIKANVTDNNSIQESIGIVSGWTPLADALKKAGIYFIYIFIPDSELKQYPDAVAKKRKTQNVFYTLIHTIDIFHSAATVKDLFRSGIIARTGMEPVNYIADLKLKNVKTIGTALATIATIISIVLGLIEIIKAIWPHSEAANYAVSSGAADFENELYTTKSNNNNTSGGSLINKASNWLPVAGLALGAFLIFKRKKTS